MYWLNGLNTAKIDSPAAGGRHAGHAGHGEAVVSPDLAGRNRNAVNRVDRKSPDEPISPFGDFWLAPLCSIGRVTMPMPAATVIGRLTLNLPRPKNGYASARFTRREQLNRSTITGFWHTGITSPRS